MTRATSRPRKTLEDLYALGDEVCAELIAGEVYVNPAPGSRHQDVLMALASPIYAHVRREGLGRLFVAPIDVHLPTGDVVQPDIVFVEAANSHIVNDQVLGVPDLLVEIVSPSHPERDRIVKRGLYERNGVREYWCVEPDDEAVEVLRLTQDGYRPAGYLRGNATLASPLVPGFAIEVGAIFE